MKVAVIGTGYVGLVTGACLSNLGHEVICVDNNVEKVKKMQAGISPIYEPGLEEVMSQGMEEGLLHFTTDLKEAVQSSEIIFIAVGTPSLPSGETNTTYVEAVAREIGHALEGSKEYKVIINKSTVPIGSGDWVRKLVTNGTPDNKYLGVVSNPEFLREGTAVLDTFNPDRIVLGSNSAKAIKIVTKLYQPLIDEKKVPVLVTDLTSAEMIKYAANAFLATKISFINEISNICELVGGDVTEVALGIGLDTRIGSKFLQAGLGWGGSCFPKDVKAMVHTAKEYGYNPQLLQATIDVNEYQLTHVIELLQRKLKVLKGKTIGLLGLTFKPDTDDVREAPSLKLASRLHKLGAEVKGYDPIIKGGPLGDVEVYLDPYEMARGCDALVLVTNWRQFNQLDYMMLVSLMDGNLFIDGRNILSGSEMENCGFDYLCMGR